MISTDRYARLNRVFCLLATGFFAISSLAHAAVTAQPTKVIFTGPDEEATIKLVENGEALAGESLTGYKLMATGSDYAHMIDVRKTEGGIVVTPSDSAEIGTYDLVLETKQGTATVKVDMPLEKLDNIVEKRAKALGISKQEARKLLGLTTTVPHPDVSIELPAVYYEGQTLALEMPKQPDTSYMWSVNGGVVAQGPDANALEYTFKKTGSYVITYHEIKSGQVVAADSAITTVAPAPAIPWTVETGQEFTLEAPVGYDTYTWEISEQYVATGRKLTYTFEVPGVYTAQCTATRKAEPGFQSFRYMIDVNQE